MNETTKKTGGCQCGTLRYEITGDPVMVVQCHCINCQKSTGTGHLSGAAFAQDNLKVSGEPKDYDYTADSGGKVTNKFCPQCGATVYSLSTNYAGMAILRLGTLDEDFDVKPMARVFQRHQRAWDKAWDEVPAFDGMPPKGG